MLDAVRLSDGAYDLNDSQSPELTGRAVAAPAADPLVLQRSGRAHAVANLARDYAFTNLDGSLPPLIDLG
jgi:dehydrogenase/reductase SDR family protein 1